MSEGDKPKSFRAIDGALSATSFKLKGFVNLDNVKEVEDDYDENSSDEDIYAEKIQNNVPSFYKPPKAAEETSDLESDEESDAPKRRRGILSYLNPFGGESGAGGGILSAISGKGNFGALSGKGINIRGALSGKGIGFGRGVSGKGGNVFSRALSGKGGGYGTRAMSAKTKAKLDKLNGVNSGAGEGAANGDGASKNSPSIRGNGSSVFAGLGRKSSIRGSSFAVGSNSGSMDERRFNSLQRLSANNSANNSRHQSPRITGMFSPRSSNVDLNSRHETPRDKAAHCDMLTHGILEHITHIISPRQSESNLPTENWNKGYRPSGCTDDDDLDKILKDDLFSKPTARSSMQEQKEDNRSSLLPNSSVTDLLRASSLSPRRSAQVTPRLAQISPRPSDLVSRSPPVSKQVTPETIGRVAPFAPLESELSLNSLPRKLPHLSPRPILNDNGEQDTESHAVEIESRQQKTEMGIDLLSVASSNYYSREITEVTMGSSHPSPTKGYTPRLGRQGVESETAASGSAAYSPAEGSPVQREPTCFSVDDYAHPPRTSSKNTSQPGYMLLASHAQESGSLELEPKSKVDDQVFDLTMRTDRYSTGRQTHRVAEGVAPAPKNWKSTPLGYDNKDSGTDSEVSKLEPISQADESSEKSALDAQTSVVAE
jgi:hypothetical protein